MGYAEKCKILEMHDLQSNWAPPVESEKEEIENARRVFARMCIPGGRSYMHIFRTEPYIDMLYIQFDHSGYPEHTKRFSIHEGFAWDYEDEQFFHAHCVRSDTCICLNKPIDIIYNLYSAAHPEWHLQRYYTHNLRVIDHVYHCMRQNTVKEMLYKAELSELAVYVDDLDEINLVANKPSDLYDGLPMRVLRALNNKEGAALLSNAADRKYIRELNARYPDLFSCSLNEAQCCYLAMLIKGRLLPGETGRLFREKKADYSYDWCRSIFALKIAGEKNSMGLRRFKQMFHDEIAVHDPVYRGYMSKIKTEEDLANAKKIYWYLVTKRDEYNHRFRVANRKRSYEWQERTPEYIIRYPQTINDFIRESVYQQNCLLLYLEACCNNDTDILFLRKANDVNRPFITIEIQHHELKQAYHRFNQDCSEKEAAWITAWCGRHGIGAGQFMFDATVDELD